MQRDIPIDAVVAVDGDVVGDACGDIDDHLAGRRAACGVVVIGAAGDQGERRDACAGVDAQERVEVATGGVDGGLAGGGCGPSVPDGFATDVAAVIGFADFLGGALVG